MESRTASDWCTTKTGASETVFNCESVTTIAISMIRSLSGSSPVISMSSQRRLFWSCAMPLSVGPCVEWHCRTTVFVSMHWFTAVFIAALALTAVIRLWLSRRHIRYVLANRDAVPAEFSASIPLAKQAALAALLLVPLVFCFLWLMARMGAMWWLYAWATWVAFSLAVQFLYPTVFVRWFNEFTPLEDAGLRSRIEGLLAKCGFRSRGLFVMDGSKRSSHGNAYFTGFGAAKRIVLFDTLISRLAPPEIEAGLAHELGHFSHRHGGKRTALLFRARLALLRGLG